MSKDYVRIALVQMDFNPAAFVGRADLLMEPTKFSHKELDNGIAHFVSDDININNKIHDIKKEIKKRYIDYLNEKIIHILGFCKSKAVDLLIFPEYSMPAECLLTINKFVCENGNINVVAGSHSVIAANDEIYDEINLSGWKKFNKQQKDKMHRKAIAPVFHASGEVNHVEKMKNTQRLDHDFIEGKWKNPIIFNIKGNNYKVPVFICIDYINDEINTSSVDCLKTADFVIVISYTLKVDPFHKKASESLRGASKAVVYVNASDEGGTKIFCHFDPQEKQQLFERGDEGGSYSIPKKEEGLIIVSVDPKKQFTVTPTPYEKYDGSIQEGVYPFFYSTQTDNISHICSKVKKAKSLSKKRELLEKYKMRIRQWGDLSEICKKKVKFLFVNDLKKEEIDFYIDCICFDGLVSPDGNRIEMLTYLTKELSGLHKELVPFKEDDTLETRNEDSAKPIFDFLSAYKREKEAKEAMGRHKIKNSSVILITNGNNLSEKMIKKLSRKYDLPNLTPISYFNLDMNEFEKAKALVFFIDTAQNIFDSIKNKIQDMYHKCILVCKEDVYIGNESVAKVIEVSTKKDVSKDIIKAINKIIRG